MSKTFEALASGETLELRIYAPIGLGMFGFGVTAEQIANEIKWSAGHKRIVVKFNSPGGNAYEGIALRAIFAEQDCETVAVIQGVAASAAGVAALGCKKVQMSVGSAFMLHEARLVPGASMSSKDLQSAAEAAETLNENLAAVYAKRTGKTAAECRKLMAAETWLTAEKAVASGFADEVVGDKENVEALAFAASSLATFGYDHVPEKFKEADPALSASAETPAETLTRDDLREAMEQLLSTRTTTTVPQPSAAPTNAEAQPASRKRESMSIQLIAQAVGLQANADESAVITAVSQLNAFAGELKSLTKASSFEAVLGAIRGLQAAAEQVTTLSATIAEQSKTIESQERMTLVAADKADPKGRKLTPALEQYWATQPIEAFKAYLAVAPHQVVVQTHATAGQQQQSAPKTAAESGSTEVLTHNGKSWEAMSGIEKHDLHETDRERYEALKNNFAERGSPRAQSQQQRASA